jgi:chromosome partitioning protein
VGGLLWLGMRPRHVPVVSRLDQREEKGDALGKGRWLIIDSPAGFHGKNLSQNLKLADKVLVPVQPSVFDMAATASFLQALREEKVVRRNQTFVGIVGVRVDPRTKAAATLEAFLRQFDLPVLTYLRDSQIYPNAAFNGLSIFDLPAYLAERDTEQWAAVFEWIAH